MGNPKDIIRTNPLSPLSAGGYAPMGRTCFLLCINHKIICTDARTARLNALRITHSPERQGHKLYPPSVEKRILFAYTENRFEISQQSQLISVYYVKYGVNNA